MLCIWRESWEHGCLVPSHHVGVHAQSSCYFPESGCSAAVPTLHHREKLSYKGFKAALMLFPGCLSCFWAWSTSAFLCFRSQVWRPAWSNSHEFCILLHYLCLSVSELSLYLKSSVLCLGHYFVSFIPKHSPYMHAWKAEKGEWVWSQPKSFSQTTSNCSPLIKFAVWYFTHIHKAYRLLSNPILLCLTTSTIQFSPLYKFLPHVCMCSFLTLWPTKAIRGSMISELCFEPSGLSNGYTTRI